MNRINKMKTDDYLIGYQLANYRIEHVLGRGGMASVYYGWDVKLDRPVAIKVIDARYRGNPAYAERFVREARVLAGWHHPNILDIYYADNQQDLYYYVMEYIRGLDLGQLLKKYKQAGKLIAHSEVVWIGRSIANALDYAHRKGVIHRDIKPSNVLVAEDGRVVLTDFGLALDVGQGSVGEVFGSPHYMAPEQARSSANAVSQSDLYSFGVILYEMLTGAVPFHDPSPTVLALKHVTDKPPAPRQFNPRLSLEVENILLKSLSKTPEERFQTGRELVDTLEEALNRTAVTGPLVVEPAPAAPVTQPLPVRGNQAADGARLPESAYSPLQERDPLLKLSIGCGVILLITAVLLILEVMYFLR